MEVTPKDALPFGKSLSPVDASVLLRSLPTTAVAVTRLLPSDSPRFQREVPGHVRALEEVDADLGSILVHRPTMRVIDGMHRLRAAIARGDEEVSVQYFEGSDDEAFVLSVQLNVRHGMPLTLAERKNAAGRIVRSHPHWSDRSIARCAGLSPKTVGKLRKCSSEEIPHLPTRMGRDGRIRPVTSAQGRVDAAAQLAASPELSLRKVAERAGVSMGTVRDVRARLRRGQSPVLEPTPSAPARAGGREAGTRSVLRKLARDPALRGTESGRKLLRMLAATELENDQWRTIVKDIPSHCAPLVGVIAASRAEEWKLLAGDPAGMPSRTP